METTQTPADEVSPTFDLADLDRLASKVRSKTQSVALPLVVFAALAIVAFVSSAVVSAAGTLLSAFAALLGFTGLWLFDFMKRTDSGVRVKGPGYGIAALISVLLLPFAWTAALYSGTILMGSVGAAGFAAYAFVALALLVPAYRLESRFLMLVAIGLFVLSVITAVIPFLVAGFSPLLLAIAIPAYLVISAALAIRAERR